MTMMTTITAGKLASRYRDVRARLGVNMKPTNNVKQVLHEAAARNAARWEKQMASKDGSLPGDLMLGVPFPPSDPLYPAIEHILLTYGVPWRFLGSLSIKTHKMTLARATVCVFLSDVTGLSTDRVGALVGRDHSSVSWYKKKYGAQVRENACFLFAVDCVKRNARAICTN